MGRNAISRAAVVALVAITAAGVSIAREPAIPGASYVVSARFPYVPAPSTVVVDVLEVGGTQLGSDVAAAQVTIDAVDSDVWQLDLSAVSGFAPDCAPRAYVVRFAPDSADCSDTGNPELCTEELVHSGGWLCKSGDEHDEIVIYPTLPIPARGITSAVISRGNPSYIEHRIRTDEPAAVFTFYTVFYYDTSGRVSQKLRSLTPPSP